VAPTPANPKLASNQDQEVFNRQVISPGFIAFELKSQRKQYISVTTGKLFCWLSLGTFKTLSGKFQTYLKISALGVDYSEAVIG